MKRKTTKTTLPLLAGLGILLIAAGCSSASENDPTSGASGGASPGPSELPAYVTDAQALVEQSLLPETFDDLKPSTPAPPFQPGKRIAIIESTAAATGVQVQLAGFKKAADAVGWTYQEFNGEGTNEGKLAAMRTALSQHFDAIYMITVDQRLVQDPMQQAYDQGIPVVSSISGNEPGTDANHVYAEVGLDGVLDGKKIASWVIADAAAAGVTPHIGWLQNPANAVVIARDEGMADVFDGCTACDITASDTYTSVEGPQVLPQRIQAMLQANPEINYVVIDIGGFTVFVAQGINQLGDSVASRVKLASFDCVPDQIARIIAEDVDQVCSGAGSEYAGWAVVDELNRALNGQPAAGNRVPVQLITEDNYEGVTTTETGFTGGFDWEAAWKDFWGVQ